MRSNALPAPWRVATFLLALAIAEALPAQRPEEMQESPSAAPVDARGAAVALASSRAPRTPTLVEEACALWGIGRNFKVQFEAGGIAFTPALGPKAPENHPVAFHLGSASRGAESLSLAPAVRTVEGLRVEYRRGDLVERYDLRDAGVEQSFVFHALPAGSGDLVVRGRLATKLQVLAEGDGLRLELPGVGGMHIGGVTGIDAAGRTARGSIRHVDGCLELALPAAFVETATLPLVLDPLIGTVFNIFAFDLQDRRPNVAYDATNDVYLVVYERIFSATDTDIRALRVDAAGAFVGTEIAVDVSLASCEQPVVANSNVRDHFVVGWVRNNDVEARSVAASTGAQSVVLAVASGTDVQVECDLGGEASTADDDVICVWNNATLGRIQAAQLGFNADNSLFVWDLTTITPTPAVPPSRPRISKGGGTTGNHLIVFESDYGTDRDPEFVLVNRELTPLTDQLSLTTAFNDERRPTVDGDGIRWVVAWQTQENTTATTSDIACRAVLWNPNGAAGAEYHIPAPSALVTADVNDDETSPFVVMTANSAIVGWTDADSVITNTYFRTVDPTTGTTCEGATQFTLAGQLTSDVNATGASMLSGGGNGDRALLVLESNGGLLSSTSDVEGQLWESADGTTLDFAGGCGADAGTLRTDCARIGNATFNVRLQSALASTPAVLVVSRNAISMPCGTCRLVADPYSGLTHFATTSVSGNAAYSLAIPNLAAIRGLDFHVQWVTADPASPSCAVFGADLTNAVRLTIQ